MKKSIFKRFKESFISSLKALFKNKGYFKYYAYLVAELFGRLLILPGLIFNQSNVKLAKMVKNENKINVLETFKKAGEQKTLFYELTSLLLNFLLFLGGMIVIAAMGGILFFIGYCLSLITGSSATQLGLVLSAPLAIVLIYFIFNFILKNASRSYVIDSIDNKSVAEVLVNTKEIGRKRKIALLINNVFIVLVYAICIFIAYFGYFTVGNFVSTYPENYGYGYLTMIVLGLVFLIFVLPVFSLTRRVVNEAIYEENHYVVGNYYDKKVHIKKVNIKDSNSEPLIALFNKIKVSSKHEDKENVDIPSESIAINEINKEVKEEVKEETKEEVEEVVGENEVKEEVENIEVNDEKEVEETNDKEEVQSEENNEIEKRIISNQEENKETKDNKVISKIKDVASNVTSKVKDVASNVTNKVKGLFAKKEKDDSNKKSILDKAKSLVKKNNKEEMEVNNDVASISIENENIEVENEAVDNENEVNEVQENQVIEESEETNIETEENISEEVDTSFEENEEVKEENQEESEDK